VVSSDGLGDYPVASESRPGALPDAPLQPGTVCYITTGAHAPGSACAVRSVHAALSTAGRMVVLASPSHTARSSRSTIQDRNQDHALELSTRLEASQHHRRHYHLIHALLCLAFPATPTNRRCRCPRARRR
jgi:molybdopterin biosynthesis enzyme